MPRPERTSFSEYSELFSVGVWILAISALSSRLARGSAQCPPARGDAHWSEIDLAAKLWVIPVKRMKGGAAHAVPLTPEIFTLLESLPAFSGGDFIFSTTGGRRPVRQG